MQKTMCDTAPSTQECATVISGCHVKWATTTVLNKGYIMEASWDSSVDRRAGGYDNGAAPSAQEFTLSNMSSMMALLTEVVYHFKHESLSSQLISAFSTIDVDEIYALGAAENIPLRHETRGSIFPTGWQSLREWPPWRRTSS